MVNLQWMKKYDFYFTFNIFFSNIQLIFFQEYNLNCNNGPNALHGGAVGWDKRNWDFEVSEFEDYSQVKFSLISKNMEEGF